MTSFKKTSTVNESGTPTESIAPTTSTAVVEQSSGTSDFKIGSVSGPVRRSDIKLPEIKIVHNTGTLQENFDPGAIVLNKEVVLSAGNESGKPVKLTVLAFRKYFLEKVDFDEGVMPRLFNNEDELKAAGLHTNWVNNEPPPAFEAGEALVAVESDVEHPHFPFNYGDKYYALAALKLNSQSSYNRAGKLIITASQWNLKDGLYNGTWTLDTRKEKLGKNLVYVPVLKSGPRNPKDLAEFFTALL